MTEMPTRDTVSEFVPPRRFARDVEWGRRSMRALSLLTHGDTTPTPVEEDRHARAVASQDELGAALAQAILVDKTVTMAQFTTALSRGITDVEDPAAPLAAFFDSVDHRPSWVDGARLERGAAVCLRSGMTGLDLLATGSLMNGYRSSATTRQLVSTGRLVGDRAGARVTETVRWWYECVLPGGMDRDRQGWQLSVHVRLMHAFVNHSLLRDEDWDVTEWGMPINQSDQAGTLALFSTTFLIGLRSLGVWVSADEGRDVMHLWRYIGWLMGIDDHWLVDDENTGRRNMCQIGMFAPGPDDNSRILADALQRSWGNFSYDRAQSLRRRINRQRLLSIQRLFSGKAGMRELGLPATLAWYVPLALVGNGALHGAARLSPAVRQRVSRRSRRRVENWLADNEPKRGPDQRRS
ncbi:MULTISPECIES: oxygenase MpaB family protein [Rhodococcus]|uniref:Oxygenase MpaB family protein n=1 Tax=Rhodococcus oxybenzonivorans TaxID=1990687 RepID=A0AAE4UZK7_9NOCA|nr:MULTISPECIES: oxygenase MpaB family protein [Rhodococcus]MDV7241839.1 oxygenase MpaB family protein [Rhodococcus oxybenzonivorans]MDV7265396.1 oxygenase MpaB family protein [Rhodococcus oxybenzonivorans]MDV7273627.1 oxygenase MpaB family protein [Rhodococcus oxybenzonivorans]MDV7334121.1 oxygenase MpaB family protein [Rhodococcus oxybenzonivorans]MDV7343540.1 oxygenase MpaB family protein [Rhodococcus oxybenzonivorans]